MNTPLSSIIPSKMLGFYFSKNQEELYVLRNEGLTLINEPTSVLKDWVLRRQRRDIPF